MTYIVRWGRPRSKGKIEAEADTGHLFNMDAVKGGWVGGGARTQSSQPRLERERKGVGKVLPFFLPLHPFSVLAYGCTFRI